MTPPKPPAPPPLPAACTECTSTLQQAAPGSVPSQIAYKMSRSASGQVRVDYGATSVITNPASGEMLLIDHAKQEFRSIPTPPGVASPQLTPPGMPGVAGVSAAAASPQMAIKDLGVKMVQGVEAHGHQIVMPPLTPPKPPAPPPVPGMPGAPAVPQPAQVPMIAETWVSTKLQMPVLTRITGSFGQSMCHCKNTVAGEPPASAFQIPQGYKQVGLPPPPAPPAPPSMPKAPSPPAMPAMPAVPSLPKAPAPPAMPSMPTPPKPPTLKF